MMSPFALACAFACPPARTTGKLACRAKTLLVLSLLMPLAACAAQPALQDAPVAAPVAQPAAPAPRQQRDAAVQDKAAAPATQAPATPSTRPAPAPSRPPASSSGTPAAIPAAERATTVGEVPTTTTTPNPAPDVASMPAAPAAVPGTPANPAPIQVGQAAAAPSAGTLVQTILALMLVLGLLIALAWAMKRYGPRVTGNQANLRMVGALNIGGRERIMVVEVGDQWIVVGASPGRVNALATMPRGEAQASATLAPHAPPAATFADWLKQTIDKRNAK